MAICVFASGAVARSAQEPTCKRRLPSPLQSDGHFTMGANDKFLLDTYSQTVSEVVDRAGASVAAVHLVDAKGGEAQGGGSGFVYTPDGYLLTNSHVVRAGQRERPAAGKIQYRVSFSDGQHYPARWVGDDPDNKCDNKWGQTPFSSTFLGLLFAAGAARRSPSDSIIARNFSPPIAQPLCVLSRITARSASSISDRNSER